MEISSTTVGFIRFAQNHLARISYEVRGAESAPVVMLLHATLSNRHALTPIADRLEATHLVLSLDARGHGASSALTDRSFTVQEMATDVYAVLEHAVHANAPVSLVGHGQGAIAALEFSRIRPDLVKQLVLVEPDAVSLLDGDLDQELVETREATRARLREASDALYKGLIDKALDLYLGRRWGSDWRSQLTGARLAAIKRQAPALAASLDALDRYQVTPEELQVLEMPTVIIAAESTPGTEQRIALKLRELLPRSEMITAASFPPGAPFTGSGELVANYIRDVVATRS